MSIRNVGLAAYRERQANKKYIRDRHWVTDEGHECIIHEVKKNKVKWQHIPIATSSYARRKFENAVLLESPKIIHKFIYH